MIKFYGYFRSSSSYRCRIAFNLKGIGYEFCPVHLKNGAQHSDSFAALNPQKILPALITEKGDVLTQSLAILEWLDETQPGAPIMSRDPIVRAHERAFAQSIACEIHPLQNLRVLQYLKAELNATAAQSSAWLARWLGDGLAASEALVRKNGGDHAFCFGDEPGLADICLVPQMFSAQRFGVDISKLSRLNEIYQNCETYTNSAGIAAFADAAPAQQPDYEP